MVVVEGGILGVVVVVARSMSTGKALEARGTSGDRVVMEEVSVECSEVETRVDIEEAAGEEGVEEEGGWVVIEAVGLADLVTTREV